MSRTNQPDNDRVRMNEACKRFERALMEQEDRPLIQKKGRTLYIVSSEARELRRFDAIYAEAR